MKRQQSLPRYWPINIVIFNEVLLWTIIQARKTYFSHTGQYTNVQRSQDWSLACGNLSQTNIYSVQRIFKIINYYTSEFLTLCTLVCLISNVCFVHLHEKFHILVYFRKLFFKRYNPIVKFIFDQKKWKCFHQLLVNMWHWQVASSGIYHEHDCCPVFSLCLSMQSKAKKPKIPILINYSGY